MRKQLYNEIKDTILAIQDVKGNPIIQFVDVWNNQLDDEDNYEPFAKPAVFIENNDIDWKTIGNKAQDGDMSFTLHIITKNYGNTHSTAPADIVDEQLNFLDIPDEIFIKMQNLSPTNCSNIVRIRTKFDSRYKNSLDTQETYKLTMRNTLASPKTTQMQISLNTTRE